MIIEKYDLFELELTAAPGAITLDGAATFRKGDGSCTVPAYWNGSSADGQARYKVRFMPMETGTWTYEVLIGDEKQTGTFECVANTGDNHGPVRAEEDHFVYDDGAKYVPFGTTSYAWINQPLELQLQTLETLKDAPFNKIRMGLFPKSMPYNSNDPEVYPFEKDENGQWDVNRLVPAFWDNADLRIRQLRDLGVEVDLILFHPYDRWGFAKLSQEDSMTYLKYCLARFGAYRHIWWSLANEYETLFDKTLENWEEYGEFLQEKDPYHHLLSIHNMVAPYPKRDWMTHVSVQAKNVNRISAWKREYGIPVIVDECGYEGNLPFEWGSFSAFEMVHQIWACVCKGAYCTHGETFHREDEVLWWAKGGKLYGESPKRIAFLKELLYNLPGYWHRPVRKMRDPNQMSEMEAAFHKKFSAMMNRAPEKDQEIFQCDGEPMLIVGEGFSLQYLGRICPVYKDVQLGEGSWRVEVIDIMEMTRTVAAEGVTGSVRVALPGKEGIAILASEIK